MKCEEFDAKLSKLKAGVIQPLDPERSLFQKYELACIALRQVVDAVRNLSEPDQARVLAAARMVLGLQDKGF
jgi:hypothetical protein